jgi:four helix bundle protein
MAYQAFEDLEVWQLARAFAGAVYRELRECRDFGFRNQITGAACSISNNIAEGAERLHRPEFIQFLGYAKGSPGEARNQLYLAGDLGYIPERRAEALRADCRVISARLFALIRALREK